MIRLGQCGVSIFPDAGFTFGNTGGTIIFKGRCNIGANSSISVGAKGKLIFGDRFMATTTFRLACYNIIEFEPLVSFGWDCIVIDTDFHRMKKSTGDYTKGYGSIHIGRGCWIGTRCLILKNTMLPSHTTVSAGTKLSCQMNIDEKCIIGEISNLSVLRKGIYRNHEENDDIIIYQ